MELLKNKNEHISALDGIRGLAIILVIFAHFAREDFYIKHFSFAGSIITKLSLMGLTGVSLFFVLSGFLITGILLNTKNEEKYFRNFYARRFLRIFPVYYLTLFFVFTILPLIINFSEQSLLLKSKQIWLWTYLSNFPLVAGIWNKSDQFALGHFWSLSVEEHFYLLWPMIIYLTDIKRLKVICKVIIAVSLIAGISSTLLMNNYLVFKFLSWTTITFSGALALGALLAVHKKENGSLTKLSRLSKLWLLIFGILFIIIGFTPRRYNADLRGIMAHEVSWFFYAGLMIYILNLESSRFIYKVFTNKIMMIFGKISYGIYVFHGILMPFFEKHIKIELIASKTGSNILAVFIYYLITIGTAFLISWISWTLIESQILKLKSYFN
jgi:peptidoglycan/LPS O-acetylase OafA/YrhL